MNYSVRRIIFLFLRDRFGKESQNTLFLRIMKRGILLIIIALLMPGLWAQERVTTDEGEGFLVGASDYDGKKIPHIVLPNYYVFAPLTFKSKNERNMYSRLVRDVKKTLPLAVEIRNIIYETERDLQSLPDERARKKYLNKKEKDLKEAYTPKMKKLTFRQGKLLIKLIDRECDQSAYKLIKLFMGSFKAVFYQSFASLFGASLKKTYDPTGEDYLIERVVVLVASGQL